MINLQLRAGLCDARSLFRPTKDDAREDRFLTQIASKLSQSGSKFNGFHLFTRLYIQRRGYDKSGATHMLSTVGAAYGRLGEDQLRLLSEEASNVRALENSGLVTKVGNVFAQLVDFRQERKKKTKVLDLGEGNSTYCEGGGEGKGPRARTFMPFIFFFVTARRAVFIFRM